MNDLVDSNILLLFLHEESESNSLSGEFEGAVDVAVRAELPLLINNRS